MKSLLYILLLLLPFSVIAQSYSVRGRVIDNHNQSVVSALIVVIDSISVGNAISNSEGAFEIKPIQSKDTYTIKITCLGFEPYEARIAVGNDVDLGNIVLQESAVTLDEILVTARTVENFADRIVYRLSEIDRNSSTSALDAMKIIPKILLGMDNNLITVRGDQVKILINGINALESDLAAIAPNDVLRIEHYENPPARFANLGLGAVINVITKKRNTGGTVATNLQNALTTGFGNDMINIQYNHRNSQIGLKYSVAYRDYDKRTLDESLAYHFADRDFSKKKNGLNSPYQYQTHQTELNFVNMKENDYTFSANLSLNIYNHDKRSKQEILQIKPVRDNYIADGFDETKYLKPAVDLYFNKTVNSNQDLTINLVSSYYDAQMLSKYHEYNGETDTIFYSLTKVRSDKHSIISDIVYSLSFGTNKLSLGIRDIYSRSEQKLATIKEENLSSKLNEFYTYAEWTGEIKKITYTLSVGVNANYFDSYELKKNYSSLYVRPALNVKYLINKESDILFNYQMNTVNPSISNLSKNPVLQDINVAYSGNPDLKPFETHVLQLSYSLYANRVLLMSDLSFDYSRKPILPYFINQTDYILQTFGNLSDSKRYNLSIFAQWVPFDTKWLRLRMFGELFRNEVAYGNDSWFNNDFRLVPSVMVNYKKWNMNLFYQSKAKILNGQLLGYTPSAAYIEISYKPTSQMSALLGWRYPFYKAWENSTATCESALISRFTTEKVFNNANMMYIQFVYNFSFGEQFTANKKKLNNVDNDSGILNSL